MKHFHGCSACGKAGHTVNTCTTQAAVKIRSLMSQIRVLTKKTDRKRKPKRKSPQLTGRAYLRAMKKYTPKPASPKRQKLVRRIPLKARQGKGLLSALGVDDKVALAALQKAGYVGNPGQKCPRIWQESHLM